MRIVQDRLSENNKHIEAEASTRRPAVAKSFSSMPVGMIRREKAKE
jgi:hypothetical protein